MAGRTCLIDNYQQRILVTVAFYIKYFGLIVEKQVYRSETVLDEVAGVNVLAQAPVVVEEALYRCQRDQ